MLLVFSKVTGLRLQFQLRKQIHQFLCVRSFYCSNFPKKRSMFKVVGKVPLNWHFEVFKVNKKDTSLGLLQCFFVYFIWCSICPTYW